MPKLIYQPKQRSNISQILGSRKFFDGLDEFMKRFEFSWSDAENCKLSCFNIKLKFVSVKHNSILPIKNDKINHLPPMFLDFMVIVPQNCIVNTP